mmetsp:Transcript_44711/g.78706  ORF Transcript_44711/g.78706 Transcript_44711/m.78706 type:complete len:112 (-) Transcript_44711:13-348(-)
MNSLASSALPIISHVSMQGLAKMSWAIENSGIIHSLGDFLRPALAAYLTFENQGEALHFEDDIEGALSTIDLINSICHADRVTGFANGCALRRMICLHVPGPLCEPALHQS